MKKTFKSLINACRSLARQQAIPNVARHILADMANAYEQALGPTSSFSKDEGLKAIADMTNDISKVFNHHPQIMEHNIGVITTLCEATDYYFKKTGEFINHRGTHFVDI